MKSLYIVALIPFILFSSTLKIATYNVDNLFDLALDGSEYKEYRPNTHNWNRVTFNKKIEHISQVLCDLNADVVALEEIENANVLAILQDHLKAIGCVYAYSAITNKRGSAIENALLSKVSLKKFRDIKVSNSASDRNILEVVLKTEPKLRIFVNHWRSKRAPESARVKYAKALIKRIKELPPNSEYIILGDFNSNYNECTVIDAKNNDTNGVCGIDRVLHTYYHNRLIKFRDKELPKNTIFHYNLWGELEPHKRWSHDFYGKKSALDSIIIPVTLADNRDWHYKRGSFGVFKKRYLFKKKRASMLYRWEYKHNRHTGRGYSDHLPLYATFTTANAKELKHESILDKFWKMFIPKVEESKSSSAKKEMTLEELVKHKFIKGEVLVKDLCVIYKRGDFGVVKSAKDSSTVTLYKSAEGLEEGRCYDFKVYKKKRYFKLDEITDLDIINKKGTIAIEDYIPKFTDTLMDPALKNYGEIVRDIRGVYKNNYLEVGTHRFRLFVKKQKRGLLKKNSKLYIKKAQIGYYKGEKELIVYSLEDIQREN